MLSLLPAQHPSPYPITQDSMNCTMKNVSAQPWYSIACRNTRFRPLGSTEFPAGQGTTPQHRLSPHSRENQHNSKPGVTSQGWGSPLASPPASAPSSSLLEKAGNESHTPQESGEAAPSWLLPRIGSFWDSLTANHNTQGTATSGDAADRVAQGSLDARKGLFPWGLGVFGAWIAGKGFFSRGSGVFWSIWSSESSATDRESPVGPPGSCRNLRRARSRLRDSPRSQGDGARLCQRCPGTPRRILGMSADTWRGAKAAQGSGGGFLHPWRMESQWNPHLLQRSPRGPCQPQPEGRSRAGPQLLPSLPSQLDRQCQSPQGSCRALGMHFPQEHGIPALGGPCAAPPGPSPSGIPCGALTEHRVLPGMLLEEPQEFPDPQAQERPPDPPKAPALPEGFSWSCPGGVSWQQPRHTAHLCAAELGPPERSLFRAKANKKRAISLSKAEQRLLTATFPCPGPAPAPK